MKKFALCLTFLSVCGVSFGVTPIGGSRPITDEKELSDLTETVTNHLKKVATQPNGAQLDFIRAHSATYQLVSGNLYKLFAEVNENSSPVNCTITLWDKPWVKDFLKLDVECGEEKRKYGYATGQERRKRQTGFGGFGGYSTMTQDQLKQLQPNLSGTFDHLRSNKPDFGLTLKNIVSGKSQVVAGTHYVVQVEATHSNGQVKQCEADILENLKGEFHQVDVKCENQSYRYSKQ